jgi:hypothetical protein
VEEKENVLYMLQRIPCSSTRRISARLNVLLKSVENFMSGDWLHPNHIQPIQHLGRAVMGKRPQCCGWIDANPHTIRNLLLTDEALSTPCGVSNTKISRKIPKRDHRITFPWMCGFTCDQIIAPNTFPIRLTGDIYATRLQHKLAALLQMFLYEHDV